jgi:hypothetical protein
MRPILKPFVRWARPSAAIGVFEGNGLGVYIRGQDTVDAFALLVPHLDGRPLVELADAAGLDEEDTSSLVELMFARNIVDDLDDEEARDPGDPADPLIAAFSAFTHTPRAARDRLHAASICVLGGDPRAEALLREHGVTQVTHEVADATACVLFIEHAPTADGPARAQREAGSVPFVPVTLDAGRAWVGPTRSPGHACWTCMQTRIQDLSTIEGLIAARASAASPRAAALPALAAAAIALAVHEVILVASRARSPRLADRVVVLGAEHREHSVLAIPGCPGCAA